MRKRNDRKGKEYRVADSQRERMTETQRCEVQGRTGRGVRQLSQMGKGTVSTKWGAG